MSLVRKRSVAEKMPGWPPDGGGAQVAALIEQLYAAASGQEPWTHVLSRLTEVFGARAALIQDFGTADGRVRLDAAVGFSGRNEETLRSAIAHDGQAGPLARLAGRPFSSEFALDPDERRRSPLFRDVLAPLDLGRVLWLTSAEADAPWLLAVFRGDRDEPFREAEETLLAELAPHVRRAFRLHDRFAAIEAERQTLAAVLDLLSPGMIVVDADLVIRHCNAAAETILAAGGGLRSVQGCLHAATRAQTALLAREVGAALSDPLPRSSVVLVDDPAGSGPQTLQIRRLPSRAGASDSLAAVVVSTPKETPSVSTAVLRDLFDLTRTEAKVAKRLTQGLSLAEAAVDMQISLATARNHLKAIYSKVGVNRQSALVRQLILHTAHLQNVAEGDGDKTAP